MTAPEVVTRKGKPVSVILPIRDYLDLVAALKVLGYQTVRQSGSHLRLTNQLNGSHHVNVPAHRPIKTGTLLGGILKPVAAHHKISVDELLQKLDL